MANACKPPPFHRHVPPAIGRTLRLVAFCVAAAVPWTTQAAAGDAGNGRQLAEQWCTNCHLIGASGPGSDTAPPFTAIAADPSKGPEHLRVWLATPHTTMPQMPLDRRNIEDVVAYITSLAP